MSAIDLSTFVFAFMAFVAACAFFWRQMNVAGFALLVAFIVALTGVSQQKVMLTSFAVGVSVEKK